MLILPGTQRDKMPHMYLSGKNDQYRKCERGGNKQAVQNRGNRLTEADKNLLVT